MIASCWVLGTGSTATWPQLRTAELAVHCFDGEDETGEAAGSCVGGGGGKGLEAALGLAGLPNGEWHALNLFRKVIGGRDFVGRFRN